MSIRVVGALGIHRQGHVDLGEHSDKRGRPADADLLSGHPGEVESVDDIGDVNLSTAEHHDDGETGSREATFLVLVRQPGNHSL